MPSKEKTKLIKMRMSDLVSIITPIYNKEDYIESCIRSVQKQTYINWELLLVDDASKDDSLSKAKLLQQSDNRIKIFKHQKNLGAARARNLGTKNASGDYIAFLDADDTWRPNKLELQINLFNNSNIDVCYSSYELIDDDGKAIGTKVNTLKELSYSKLLRANYIGNLTGVYNSKKLGKIYTEDIRKRQDWLLWLEALKRSKKNAIGIPETLADYRISRGSLSSNKLDLLKYNFSVYRKGLGFSVLKSAIYLLLFLYEHLVVKNKLIQPIDKK